MTHSRLAILILLTTLLSPFMTARALSSDDAVTTARNRTQEAVRILQKDAGALWGDRLDRIPWFFILDQTVYLTTDPKVEPYQFSKGFWTGPLPTGIAPSNSALEWSGRKWAMVLLPLPTDPKEAVRLMIHEAWHVIQPKVLPVPGFKEIGRGSSLLDEPEGRIWLQLEYRALADALRLKGEEQDKAIASALIFRAQRYVYATAEERDRERILDIYEGLAEYTGWKLSGAAPIDFASHLMQNAFRMDSYIRTFVYFTGPAYAQLLDQRLPGWIKILPQDWNLQTLLAGTLKAHAVPMKNFLNGTGSRDEIARLALQAGTHWDYAALRKSETARWEERQRKIAELRRVFVEGPTLRIRPRALQISFNPSKQISLDDKGTVMVQLVWKGADGGMLSAPEGALVSPDWKEVRVPVGTVKLDAGKLSQPREWRGAGWILSLPKGWNIRSDGTSWVAEP